MRFSLKLVLCTTVITALLFSVCGTLMVKENFDRSMELAVKQNEMCIRDRCGAVAGGQGPREISL